MSPMKQNVFTLTYCVKKVPFRKVLGINEEVKYLLYFHTSHCVTETQSLHEFGMT